MTVSILKHLKTDYEQAELDKAVELWDKGWSFKDIAHALDIDDAEGLLVLMHLNNEGKLKYRERGIFGTVDNDQLNYDSYHRLNYNELLHFNQGKVWNMKDSVYLCKYADADGLKSVSLALGRTYKSVAQKLKTLKKEGLYEQYKHTEVSYE